MLLTIRDGTFLFGSSDRQGEAEGLAKVAGLSQSLPASRNRGYPVYFATDPHSVLHLWEHADDSAKISLSGLREAYIASSARDAQIMVPTPQGHALLPYQRAGVAYAANRRNVLFGDAPGLGKTIEAIALANYRGAKRVLVVCPANVRRQWEKQIRAWSTIPRVLPYLVAGGSDGVHPQAHYVIVSYELARDGLWSVLMGSHWDMVIIDEAHYLKTSDATRTRALFGGGEARYKAGGITSRADSVVALTGTPLPNRPRECYTICRALDWSSIDWMSEARFRDRFNPGGVETSFRPDGSVRRFAWEYTGRLPELNARLRCNLMVRRLKEDVLKDLPPKRYELTYVDSTYDIQKALRAERLLDIDPDGLINNGFVFDGEISTVRRQMGEAMAPQAVEHVDMRLDEGVDKLVVYYHHKSVGDYLADHLKKHGVVRVDGSTPQAKRSGGPGTAVERFVHDPTLRVFLAQGQAVGVGTDGLQDAAQLAVFAEASWVHGDNEQCVDRLHRMGQLGSVLAEILVAQGSLAERIIGKSIDKGRITHTVLDGEF